MEENIKTKNQSPIPNSIPEQILPVTEVPKSKPKFKPSISIAMVFGFLLLVGGAFATFIIIKALTTPFPLLNDKIPKLTPNSNTYTNNNPNPTTNWKTYENAKYGFSLNYPNDWTIKDDNFVNIYPSSYDNQQGKEVIGISVVDNPNNLSLSEFQAEYDKNDAVGSPPIYYSSGDTAASIGGATGYKHACSLDGSQPLINSSCYVISSNKKIYLIRNLDWPGILNQDEVFQQLLSTFKFTK